MMCGVGRILYCGRRWRWGRIECWTKKVNKWNNKRKRSLKYACAFRLFFCLFHQCVFDNRRNVKTRKLLLFIELAHTLHTCTYSRTRMYWTVAVTQVIESIMMIVNEVNEKKTRNIWGDRPQLVVEFVCKLWNKKRNLAGPCMGYLSCANWSDRKPIQHSIYCQLHTKWSSDSVGRTHKRSFQLDEIAQKMRK